MKSAVVLLSGGMDSSVLLAQTIFEDFSVIPVSIVYGQRHVKELRAADLISEHYDIPANRRQKIILQDNVLKAEKSSQTGNAPVPHGHYAEETMKATVVPNRNMVFLSIAVAQAIAFGAEEVRYAAHAGDHAIYPDCREDFIDAMRKAIALCDWNPPRLVAPFSTISKADIVNRGLQLRVPFRKTWTCYEGNDLACGKCGTCVERLEAFALVGVADPLEYTDREFWKEAVKR
jgi:7-cyano-7-deazaguanine synthase